ncbi:MAG: AAA family ATPase [Nocardioidaceae bacterium]
MRLHHLTVSAFGPFAGTEELDFEELNDSGLFLMTGPTGAGKSSVLDAICFALYGQVPGVRAVKTLKSQHAAADARPEVVLDLSIRDRRFVIRRSPEWSRPKRRGDGTTVEKAQASIIETTDGTERLLSSRAAEVGLLVGELMGMQAAQFTQVAMLPQGEFQHFLRASSQDRHAVLERLFRTDRFSRIEEWVADHSRTLRDRAGQGERDVQRLLDTMADRAGVDLPEDLTGDTLATSDHAVAHAVGWAEELLAEARSGLVACSGTLEDARTAATTARVRHDEASALHAALGRRTAAVSTLAVLDESQATEDDARARLEADARASRCAAVLTLLDDAAATHTRLAAARDESRSALTQLAAAGLAVPHPVTGAALADLEREIRSRITRTEGLLPRERALRVARETLGTTRRTLAERQEQAAQDAERLAELPAQRGTLTAQLDAATQTASRVEALDLEQAAATARHAAAQAVPEAMAAVSRLQEDERAARDHALDARQRLLDVVERRLAGMAAELAGRLEDGTPCQVCGSTDHPALAAAAVDAVTEQDQQDATAEHERLTAAHDEAAGRAAEAQRTLDGLHQAAQGLSPDEAAGRVAEVERSLEAARQAARDRADLTARLTRLDGDEAARTQRLHALQTEIATLEQAGAAAEATIEQITAEIATAVGADTGDDTGPLDTVLDGLRRALDRVGSAGTAWEQAEDAAERFEQLAGQAGDLVREQGFGAVAEARAALLGPDTRDRLTALLDERDRTRARARLVLDDPEVHAAGEADPPDLDARAVALAEAERTLAEASGAHTLAEQLVAALGTSLGRLQETLVAWSPVREESVRAESMAKLVRGMGGDNQLQMRLSAYVLATRLDQVVDAANERLAHMRDQRYLLQRTGRATRKRAQAGLGLEVVDEWTGDVRDPATLSGGETFVISLSLALGLADVVTQEAGGVEIETLFVDEGFGMLDADTLDDVMDRLDGLRAGGRTVGVVSHVTEIRNRIPTQVHVEKRRDGSSLTVRTTVA